VTIKKFRGSATKKGKGWHIEISEEFKQELDTMDPDEREDLMKVISGLRNGTVDPLSIGTRKCNYCSDDIKNVPIDTDICRKCQEELR